MPVTPINIITRCPRGALFLETESASPGGRGTWYCRAPAAHTLDDVLSADYFGLEQTANQTRGLRPGDLIDIEPETAIWRVQTRVMALKPQIQQVMHREQQRWDYSVKPPAGYRFEWEGGDAKWVVYKGEHRIDGGFETQDEALAFIKEKQREKVVA